jgi:hypothetical protein
MRMTIKAMVKPFVKGRLGLLPLADPGGETDPGLGGGGNDGAEDVAVDEVCQDGDDGFEVENAMEGA